MENKIKKLTRKIALLAETAYLMTWINVVPALAAVDLGKSYSVKVDSSTDPMSLFMKVAFYILRGMGIGLVIYGIAGVATARSDGDSSQIMNQIGKLVGGAVLFGLPQILSAAGIIG
ncbi:MAG: hypothetical protein K6F00_06750 [Lachnospiraceae bacterium]|nr:hypothetical protein [Lachnospiraceae bacterium]